MQFHVDHDSGSAVTGWITPDNPSAVPFALVSLNDLEPIKIVANVMRPDLKELGHHRTGMVGFCIDESCCPGLSTAQDIKIWEAETHVLVYGRFFAERHSKLKLFFLDLNAVPQTRVNAIVWQKFAMPYHAIERYSFDTLFCILNNPFSQSIYATGRPFFRRYQQLLAARGFAVVTMLCDPYEELAERLLFTRYVLNSGSSSNLMQHLNGLEPLLDLCANLDISSEQSIKVAFSSLTEPQEQALANPFVRALACDFGEPAERKHVGIALDNLATMNVVGLRQRFDTFKSILQELFGMDLLEEVQTVEATNVPDVAMKLARNDRVKSLLAHDSLLYTMAREAIGKAIAVT
jgi:hypothetical protein